MPHLHETVKISDPLIDGFSTEVKNPGIDTWHDHTLITKETRNKIKTISDGNEQSVSLSSGMDMLASTVEISVQIGNIKINKLTAMVVDGGHHGIVFGKDIFDYIFNFNKQEGSESARVSSPWKDDPSSAALELYPVEAPVKLIHIEIFLKNLRRMHNLALVANGEVSLENRSLFKGRERLDLLDVVANDVGIPTDKTLKLTWVDNGSIWITVKSGSKNAMEYATRMFRKGATAKLSQELAAASEAQTKASIDEATREATISRIVAEEDMLKSENISKTYEIWRKESLAKVDHFDELISRVEDEKLRVELTEMKQKYVAEIVSQSIVPVVRNIPRDNPIDPDVILLGAPETTK